MNLAEMIRLSALLVVCLSLSFAAQVANAADPAQDLQRANIKA